VDKYRDCVDGFTLANTGNSLSRYRHMQYSATDLERLLERARARRSLPAPDVRRHLRVMARLSQSDVAAYLGVERATVSRWETGSREPRGATLDRYLAVLDALGRDDRESVEGAT
jgi:DNA-binding transcriptional regulator YiaG